MGRTFSCKYWNTINKEGTINSNASVPITIPPTVPVPSELLPLAPTGRAAKVFSAYAGHPAFTIHKKIYRQQSFSNEVSNFSVNDNLTTHTLYIVDEASMISNEGLSGAVFGTGRLLDDLIQFVYSGTGCRLILMGDTAQLPPVGEEQSPALFAEALKGYGLMMKKCKRREIFLCCRNGKQWKNMVYV